jgi:hypothetical protein
MANLLKVAGQFIAYEYEKISNEFAEEIKLNGISEETLLELDYSNGSDMGLVDAAIYFDDELVDQIQVQEISSTKKMIYAEAVGLSCGKKLVQLSI